MMESAHSFGEHGDGGYVVRRPRVTDAVGDALLRGYEHARTLPDDMRRLIERLDRQPYRRA